LAERLLLSVVPSVILGMPPQRYQLSQRIERAKTLLAKRAVSVTDVSLMSDTTTRALSARRFAGSPA